MQPQACLLVAVPALSMNGLGALVMSRLKQKQPETLTSITSPPRPMQLFMHPTGSWLKDPPRDDTLLHLPLVQVLHFLPVESAGTGKHRHQQQQAFHRSHGKRWNLQTKAMTMQFSLIQFGLIFF